MRSSNPLRDSSFVFITFRTLPAPRKTTKGHFKCALDEILFLVVTLILKMEIKSGTAATEYTIVVGLVNIL